MNKVEDVIEYLERKVDITGLELPGTVERNGIIGTRKHISPKLEISMPEAIRIIQSIDKMVECKDKLIERINDSIESHSKKCCYDSIWVKIVGSPDVLGGVSSTKEDGMSYVSLTLDGNYSLSHTSWNGQDGTWSFTREQLEQYIKEGHIEVVSNA